MCTTFVLGILGGQKRVLEPTVLELLMVVSHHVGAARATRTLNPKPSFEPPLIHSLTEGATHTEDSWDD